MWATGYTVEESSFESEKNIPSLSNLRINRDKLASEIEKKDLDLLSFEDEIKKMQEDLREGKKELERLKKDLFEIDSQISDLEIGEASEMIEKLKELGFDVYKKDSIEMVYIHFPEEERVFGIKGKMFYNNESIGDKFNKHNFDQLYGKKLKLIDIPEAEMEAHTKMNHWIKRSFDRLGESLSEKKVQIVFTAANGVEILSKNVFIQFERINKKYKVEDLKAYADVYFTIREVLPHE